MTRLSVNINKIATLRNARGGRLPDVCEAAEVCMGAGAHGITVHPRADERHIRRTDVVDVAAVVRANGKRGDGTHVEYNVEGDPRPEFVDLVLEVAPDQCTLVPVRPGEITSEAGWPADTPHDELSGIVKAMHARGVRVAVFVEPDPAPIEWAAALGADRVELYTEPYARAHAQDADAVGASVTRYAKAASYAAKLGLGVNAGHDLSLSNLADFVRRARIDEVSIGHALVSRAVFVGLDTVVREYVSLLDNM